MSYITQNYKRSLVFALLLLIPHASAFSQGGQGTPQELGQSKAAATRAKDKSALRSLIHPQVVKHMQENDPGKLEELLNAWTVMEIPENYLFAVKPVSEISEYDAQTQTMNVTGQPMYFPVPPTHFMVFVVEREKTVNVGGKEETKTERVPLGVDPIREENGKWYILLPGVKDKE